MTQAHIRCGRQLAQTLHLGRGALRHLAGRALLYERPHVAGAVLRGGRLQPAAAVAGAAHHHLQALKSQAQATSSTSSTSTCITPASEPAAWQAPRMLVGMQQP